MLSHQFLRHRCNCADCRSGLPVLAVGGAQDLAIVEIRPVGAYAIQLVFSDGHDRGIYPWRYLRELVAESWSAYQTHPQTSQTPASN